MATRIVYAAAPTVHLRAGPGARRKVQQLLWGDRVKLRDDAPRDGDWVQVRSRRVDGWVRVDELQGEPLLEVTFVDVGQGDGVLMVTPDDRHYVLDAGKGRDMADFLAWRYGLLGPGRAGVQAPHLEAAILTHSDLDHFGGFRHIFANPRLRFRHLYHNGLVERDGAGKQRFGAVESGDDGDFVVELVERHGDLVSILESPARPGTQHVDVLAAGRAARGFRYNQMLDRRDGHLRHHKRGDLRVEVLGPVVEPLGTGRLGLRWLGTAGRTKNGHSVTLRVVYRGVSVLLGGDLNEEAQRLLLSHHTGLDGWDDRAHMDPDLARAHHAAAVNAARAVFQSDVAKACHHGSSDISEDFLRAVDAAVVVVSSGDDESYAHPRPETLGALGKHGRGDRPLLYSTELARTSRDTELHPRVLHRRMEQIDEAMSDPDLSDEQRSMLATEREELETEYPSKVAIQGSIYLRTDGHRIVMAQKLETSKANLKWHATPLVQDGAGGWRQVKTAEFRRAAP